VSPERSSANALNHQNIKDLPVPAGSGFAAPLALALPRRSPARRDLAATVNRRLDGIGYTPQDRPRRAGGESQAREAYRVSVAPAPAWA